MTEKTCQHCGNVFAKDPRNTWAYWRKAKYCSQRCAGLFNSERAAAARPSIASKFAEYVSKSEGCWHWTGARDKDGYGLLNYTRTQYRAAKLALELDGRPVPAGLYACHTCDNPCCVRPDHLYPGTPTQNMADAIARGRLNPGKRAKLTPDQVRAIRAASGTHESIAASFGVTRATVSLIIERKTWRHLS